MPSSRDKLRKKSREKKEISPTRSSHDAFDAVIAREQKKNIVILPELQSLIPPLQEDELKLLEESIREEGLREDLLLWRDPSTPTSINDFTLIDGHNRYQIIKKIEQEGKAIKYGVKIMEFSSLDAVKDWMIINQLGRRNLTNEQRSYLRGLRYERDKSKHGGARNSEASPQNGNLKTHEKLAEEYSVSKNTILRDSEFARGIEKIGTYNPKLKREILAGKQKVKKSAIQFIAKNEVDKNAFKSPSKIEDVAQNYQKIERKKSPTKQQDAFSELKRKLLDKLETINRKSVEIEFKMLRELIDELEDKVTKMK